MYWLLKNCYFTPYILFSTYIHLYKYHLRYISSGNLLLSCKSHSNFLGSSQVHFIHDLLQIAIQNY